MRRMLLALAGGLLPAGAALAADAAPGPVSQEEARDWIRYTVPLPKPVEVLTGMIDGMKEAASGFGIELK